MKIRCLIGLFGVVIGVGLLPAADPTPTPTENVNLAARSIARSARSTNVVPATFRAHLVVDNRFKLMIKQPDGTETPDPRNRTGKLHCLVCEYGLSPVVAIFVRADTKGKGKDTGLGKLIMGIDELVPKYRADKLAAFVMFLRLEGGPKPVTIKGPDGADQKVESFKEYPDDEKREQYVNEIKTFAADVPAENVPFGLAPVDSPSIRAFGIGEMTPVTVIIYNRLRIVQRWDLTLNDLTDEKIAEIRNATEAMITGGKK